MSNSNDSTSDSNGKSAHTPGPWIVWEPETETGSGSDEKATGIVIARERPDMNQEIATVNCESFFFKGDDRKSVASGILREPYWPTAPSEAIANAKLIAAAPMLLNALRSIVRAWESVPEDTLVPEEINVDSLWKKARKAIAKAEGGAA